MHLNYLYLALIARLMIRLKHYVLSQMINAIKSLFHKFLTFIKNLFHKFILRVSLLFQNIKLLYHPYVGNFYKIYQFFLNILFLLTIYLAYERNNYFYSIFLLNCACQFYLSH